MTTTMRQKATTPQTRKRQPGPKDKHEFRPQTVTIAGRTVNVPGGTSAHGAVRAIMVQLGWGSESLGEPGDLTERGLEVKYALEGIYGEHAAWDAVYAAARPAWAYLQNP